MSMAELRAALDLWDAHLGRPPDVICIQETKASPAEELELDGYACFRRDVKRGARGQATFVELELLAVRDPDLEVDDVLVVVVPETIPPLWVVNVHRKGNDFELFDDLGRVFSAADDAGAALLFAGDFNMPDFDGARQSGAVARSPRTGGADDVRICARLAAWRTFPVWLTGLKEPQASCFTRVAPQAGRGVSELDAVLGNSTAVDALVDSSVENGVIGRIPFAPLLASDHRAVRVRLVVRCLPTSRRSPQPMRCVHYATASEEQRRAFAETLAALLAEVEPRLRSSGLPSFCGSVDRAAFVVVDCIQSAEDSTIGSSRRARSASACGADRFLSEAALAARGIAALLRREVDVARCRRYSGDGSAVGDVAFAALEAALAAATGAYFSLRRRDVGVGAHELMLGVNPRAHEMSRLHGVLQRVVLDKAGKGSGSTVEFAALADDEGRCLFGGEMEEHLRSSMGKMHTVDADDPSFDSESCRELEAAHDEWARGPGPEESRRSRLHAGNAARWSQFDARVDGGAVPTDAEWQARCAADASEEEVEVAVGAMCAGTAASPADDVRPMALKLGGRALWRVLALLFSACLELGAVPSCWTVGYVKWLHKKGSQLRWLNFRGIVLTSVIGKTFERVLLARLQRWADATGVFHCFQAVGNWPIGAVHQVHLVHGVAARRAARGEGTWLLLIDIARAFPSTLRSLVWRRLRQKGMGGALLRVVTALFANTARMSVAGGYTAAVARELGLPEGYVLSPFFFSLVICELLELLQEAGLGVHVDGVWAGAAALMDDVALLGSSFRELRLVVGLVAEWCWRRRFLLQLPKCELLGCGDALTAMVGSFVGGGADGPDGSWQWPEPDAVAQLRVVDGGLLALCSSRAPLVVGAGARHRFCFRLREHVKYLGFLLSHDLSSDVHVRAALGRARRDFDNARQAVAVLSALRRKHVIVGHCAYSRAYVEWAGAIFVALTPSVARGLELLQDDFLRLAAGPALADAHPSALRSLLGCSLPVGRRLSVLRARFAFDLAIIGRRFPARGAICAALERDGSLCSWSPRAALDGLSLVCPEPPAWERGAMQRARRAWRDALLRAALQVTAESDGESSPPQMRLLLEFGPSPAWVRSVVLPSAASDAAMEALLLLLCGVWQLVPAARAALDGMSPPVVCGLCGRACGCADEVHVMLECTAVELVEVRRRWLADALGALARVGLVDWWADLQPVRRLAVLLGGEAPGVRGHTAALRVELSRAFVRHFGAWWAEGVESGQRG